VAASWSDKRAVSVQNLNERAKERNDWYTCYNQARAIHFPFSLWVLCWIGRSRRPRIALVRVAALAAAAANNSAMEKVLSGVTELQSVALYSLPERVGMVRLIRLIRSPWVG
jgi:hypothetical protein